MMSECPQCKEKSWVVDASASETIYYRGTELYVMTYFSFCVNCRFERVDQEQMLKSIADANEEKRWYDYTMERGVLVL